MAINPPPRNLPVKFQESAYFQDQMQALYQLWDAVSQRLGPYLTGDRLFSGNPGLAIDTNFDVQTVNALVVAIDGDLFNVAAATCDTGTTATFPAGLWGVFLVSSDSSGGLTATWATNNSNGFDSEKAAISALPPAPADEAPIGYVTVQAHAANSFTAGTDALQGGAGGNPSQDTNYYNRADAGRALTSFG